MRIKAKSVGYLSFIALVVFGTSGFKKGGENPLDWTGPFAGINLGVTSLNANYSANAPDGGLPAPELMSIGADGSKNRTTFSGGVQAGYNYAPKSSAQIHPVIGVVADYSYSGLSASRTVTIDSSPMGIIHQNATSDWQGTVRANVGLAAGSAQIYGTAGVILVNNNITNQVCFDAFGCNTAISGHSTYTSGVYGLGVDYFVTPRFLVGVTALWSNWSNLYQYSYGVDSEGNELDEDSLVEHNTNRKVGGYALRFNYKFDVTA